MSADGSCGFAGTAAAAAAAAAAGVGAAGAPSLGAEFEVDGCAGSEVGAWAAAVGAGEGEGTEADADADAGGEGPSAAGASADASIGSGAGGTAAGVGATASLASSRAGVGLAVEVGEGSEMGADVRLFTGVAAAGAEAGPDAVPAGAAGSEGPLLVTPGCTSWSWGCIWRCSVTIWDGNDMWPWASEVTTGCTGWAPSSLSRCSLPLIISAICGCNTVCPCAFT